MSPWAAASASGLVWTSSASTFSPDAGGTFTSFGGLFSDFCVTQSGSGSGSTLNLETCSSNMLLAQHFTVSPNEWTINGLCLGVPGGNFAAGAVHLETCGTGGGTYES